MVGSVIDLKKGDRVLYEGKEYHVFDVVITCPCAMGDTQHHPSIDLVLVDLGGGLKVPRYKVKIVEPRE
jgi:hypothetical protein